MKRLSKLGDSHRAAARMRVEGIPNAEIRRALNVSERTLHIWFSDDLVKAHIEELREKIDDVFAERMASAALTGLNQLVEMSTMPLDTQVLTPRGKLEILRELVDRHPATSRVEIRQQSAQTAGSVNVLVGGQPTPIEQVSDDELIKRARAMLGQGDDYIDAEPAE